MMRAGQRENAAVWSCIIIYCVNPPNAILVFVNHLIDQCNSFVMDFFEITLECNKWNMFNDWSQVDNISPVKVKTFTQCQTYKYWSLPTCG